MQQLTLALSPNGVTKILTEMATLLSSQALSIPDQKGVAGGQDIPLDPCDIYLNNLDLLQGGASNMSASGVSATQQSDGSFNVTLNASFTVAFQQWHETGNMTCPSKSGWPINTPFDNTYGDFYFNVSTVTFAFNLAVAVGSQGGWSITASNGTSSNLSIGTIHIPSQSALNDPSIWPCVNSAINDKVSGFIGGYNYAGAFVTALNSLLSGVPDSGHLTSDIVFAFAPNKVTTPSGGGIATGVNGAISYKGAAFSSTAPDVPLPAGPLTDDVTVYVGPDEFNGLFWCMFSMGSLSILVVPGDLTNPQLLNTATYKTLWPALYNFAPDASMQVQFSPVAAPVASIGSVYCITTSVLAGLKSQIPTDVANELSAMLNATYTALNDFNTAVTNTIGAADFAKYGTIVAAAARTSGLSLAVDWEVDVYAIVNASPSLAFSLTLTLTGILENMQVDSSKSPQVLTFGFGEADVDASVTKSNIGTINPTEVDMLWMVVAGYIGQAIANFGAQGVPLPSISGFTYTNTSVGIGPSYVGVAADIGFSSTRKLGRPAPARQRDFSSNAA